MTDSTLPDVKRLMEEASPRPWRNPEANGGFTVYAGGVMDATTMVIADCGWGRGPTVDPQRGRADAALIVASVNRLPLYEEALDWLAALLDAMDETGADLDRLGAARNAARSILSKLGRGIEESPR